MESSSFGYFLTWVVTLRLDEVVNMSVDRKGTEELSEEEGLLSASIVETEDEEEEYDSQDASLAVAAASLILLFHVCRGFRD